MATTTKGYPYPIGTDRVMDGDNAIQALAEAVDADANWTKATTLGNTQPGAATPVQWNAAAPNGCALTKTSASLWTVTKAGIYVISATPFTTGFQAARAYVLLVINGTGAVRSPFPTENTATVTGVFALVPGDTIEIQVFTSVGTNIAPTTGLLHVARLGRT